MDATTQGRVDRSTLVWWLLLAATAMNWALAQASAAWVLPGASSGPLLLLLVAFFKVRLVMLHFMELATAPRGLRLAAEAWVMLTCVALVVQLFF